jgi:hypothetical protein
LLASAGFVREGKGGVSSPANRSHVRAGTNVSRHLIEMDNAADHVLYRPCRHRDAKSGAKQVLAFIANLVRGCCPKSGYAIEAQSHSPR